MGTNGVVNGVVDWLNTLPQPSQTHDVQSQAMTLFTYKNPKLSLARNPPYFWPIKTLHKEPPSHDSLAENRRYSHLLEWQRKASHNLFQMKPCLKPETRRESWRVFASKSLSVLVPPRRIERPARGLGNRCSIHWATGATYDFNMWQIPSIEEGIGSFALQFSSKPAGECFFNKPNTWAIIQKYRVG